MSLFNFDHHNRGLVLAGGMLVLAGGVLGGGCGGTDTSTIEGFCQAVAAAACSEPVVRACFGANDAVLEQDTNLCIASRSRLSNCNPDGLIYYPQYADQCVAEYWNAFASGGYDKLGAEALREACLPALNSGHTTGATCNDDIDCNVGAQLRCVKHVSSEGKLVGTCQIPHAVGGGYECSQANAECPEGQYCGSSGYCQAAGKANKECDAAKPCAPGFRCAETVCEAQYPDGHGCKVDNDCANGFCVELSSGAGQCAATYMLSMGTAACRAFINN